MSTPGRNMECRIQPWSAWPGAVEPVWSALWTASPRASFFVSAAWMSAWLACFGGELAPEFVIFETAGKAAGICLLVRSTRRVRGLPVRRVYLNCFTHEVVGIPFLEYNALLAAPGAERAVTAALAGHLKSFAWEEFCAPGLTADASLAALTTLAAEFGQPEEQRSTASYVNLEELRATGRSYDAELSANTRQQIRRSLKIYEQEFGPVSLSAAASAEEALAWLDELACLHQKRWEGKGKPGSFASPQYVRFHRTLIGREFSAGGVQLLRASAGGTTVGVLYNFLSRGALSFYQSGFHYTEDNRLKPGLMTHYLAVQYCLERTLLREYDFLAGDSQYKRSLARANRDLVWLTYRGRTAAARLISAAKAARNLYAQFAARPAQPG